MGHREQEEARRILLEGAPTQAYLVAKPRTSGDAMISCQPQQTLRNTRLPETWVNDHCA